MTTVVAVVALIAAVVAAVAAQPGPGMGPWQTATPESQGLNSTELTAAELRVLEMVPGRLCYLVVKNGLIVYEKYYNGWTESRIKQGYSTTKSHCSALYGIATEQGWANASEYIRDRNNNNTRECNPAAQFVNALTMTGESENLANPSFLYDTDGTQCLDTLSDFVALNNPEGLTTEEFKDKYWQQAIGMEHMSWTSNPLNGGLMCGYTSEVSCRDMARAAQLWLNEGVWAGQQIINRDHILRGRTFVYPNSNPPPFTEYGYTVWRVEDDPVDELVHSFMGALSQCAFISPAHQAVIVSMGVGDVVGARCFFTWTESRQAIVSGDSEETLLRTAFSAAQLQLMRDPPAVLDHAGVLALRRFAETHSQAMMAEEISALNDYLLSHNEAPVRAAVVSE